MVAPSETILSKTPCESDFAVSDAHATASSAAALRIAFWSDDKLFHFASFTPHVLTSLNQLLLHGGPKLWRPSQHYLLPDQLFDNFQIHF